MRKHKLSLWDSETPSEKPLEPCRELLFSIDESGKFPTLNVTQGKLISVVAHAGKEKPRLCLK